MSWATIAPMKTLFLLLACLGLWLAVLITPSRRNQAIAGATVAGCAWAVLASHYWPQALTIAAGAPVLCVGLWLAGRFALWPFRLLAQLLRH